MWTVSVSLMIISIYFVCEAVLSQPVTGGLPWRETDAQALHRTLRHTLMAAVGCFFFGFFSSYDWRQAGGFLATLDLLPNMLCFSISTLSHYKMLFNLNHMLQRAQNHPLLLVSGVFRQIRLVRCAILLVWHLFPIVWILAALDILDAERERIGYICCDLTAKYLLLFVYTTTVSNQ